MEAVSERVTSDGRDAGSVEHILAALLRYGAVAASVCLAIGMLFTGFSEAAGLKITAFGVAMLILLPVFRVALMVGIFLKEKEYRFAAIAGTVLFLIALGFVGRVLHGA